MTKYLPKLKLTFLLPPRQKTHLQKKYFLVCPNLNTPPNVENSEWDGDCTDKEEDQTCAVKCKEGYKKTSGVSEYICSSEGSLVPNNGEAPVCKISNFVSNSIKSF